MKNLFTVILLYFALHTSFAQGLLINEFSNGDSGSKEYIELIVLGDGTTCNPVDLTGWIIDDNNGDFGTSGVARGYIALGSAFSSMTPGDIIVIYNELDVNSNVSALTSGNGVYVYAANDTDIVGTGTSGSGCTPSPAPLGQSGCTDGSPAYTGTLTAGGGTWASIGYRNDGDAALVRKPDCTLFHALVYGDLSAGTTKEAVQVSTSKGSKKVYSYGCNAMYTDNTYSTATATADPSTTAETPGKENNADNLDLITAIKNCSVDYAKLISDDASFTCIDITTPVLPVELARFTAREDNETVVLDWTTASELNNDRFEVEYATNGVDFVQIGTVAGNGTTTGAVQYEFLHNEPIQGTNYYRLRQVGFDGTYEYSVVATIQLNTVSPKVYVRPTVATAKAELVIENALNLAGEVIVLDVTGKEVVKQFLPEGTTSMNLDLISLANGHYFVKVVQPNQSFITRFIKK